MSQNKRARVAVVAAAALVGGLVPVLGATAALAVTNPTAVSVTPIAANISVGKDATFTAAANNAGDVAKVMYAVQSGPDVTVNKFKGIAAAEEDGVFAISNGGVAGVDKIAFFFDISGDGNFQPATEPSTLATLTIGGDVNAVTLTPASGHVAQFGYSAFTVAATDIGGRAVPDAAIQITAAEMLPDGVTPVPTTTLSVVGDASAESFFAVDAVADVKTLPVTTADGTLDTTAGSATVYIASKLAGSVALSANFTDENISDTAVLTVNPGTMNDVKSVVLTPETQNAFTGSKPVTATITLRNAQGDLVSAVTPVTDLTAGPNKDIILAVPDATDGTGTTTIGYSTGTIAGTDSVLAFVNQTGGTKTGGLDASEPSGTASVVVAAEPAFTAASLVGSADVTVPVDITTSSPVTFTLTLPNGTPAVGYNVSFTQPEDATPVKYTLSSASAITDVDGKVSVSVTNAKPGVDDGFDIIATLVGDPIVTDTVAVVWDARTGLNGVVISPAADSQAFGASVTHTVATSDQFGDPITGLSYTWSVTGRNNALNNETTTGTGASFTYTDSSELQVAMADEDAVTVIAKNAADEVVGEATVSEYWVLGTAKAVQANIDLVGDSSTVADGSYGSGPLFTADDFQKTLNAGVSTDLDPTIVPVSVRVADAAGLDLFGKSISFSSTGAGAFADPITGELIGATTSALIADNSAAFEDGEVGFATVYVRSAQAGEQTITASVDGIIDTAVVNYTGEYVSNSPVRVLDTRTDIGFVSSNNRAGAVDGRLVKNTQYGFSSEDLPDGAAAYAFNVTAISPDGVGNLAVTPWLDNKVPTTSLVNYQANEDVANFVIVPAADVIKLYSANASAAVAIDLVGYYPAAGSGYSAVVPSRIGDTRTENGGSGQIVAGTTRSFQVAGKGTIPVGATSVALNITAVGPTDLGNLTVYPTGSDQPAASNVNYIVGQDKAAFVVVKLGTDGKINLASNAGSANVAIDAFGYYTAGDNLVTSVPERILDTREGTSLAANSAISIPVAGLAGVPTNAQAVLVSVTSIHNAASTGAGHLRVYPSGVVKPVVSTLNYVSSTSDVANFAIVRLGTDGEITLYSDSSPIDVAVDVLGYVPAGK